jgi:hypothetical protein
MTSALANNTLVGKVKDRLTTKAIITFLLIQLVLVAPGVGWAESENQIQNPSPSNEEFLRESIRSLIGNTFDDFPRSHSKFILLKTDKEHPANWLLEDELISYLLSSQYQVGLLYNENSEKSAGSLLLFYRIIELSLDYPEIKRKGFFGRRFVTRRASLNFSFRLEDNETGRVLWSKRGKDKRIDQIERSMIKSLNNESYPILSPSLPQDSLSRFIEPALVVAVVGGLIYLFFANR